MRKLLPISLILLVALTSITVVGCCRGADVTAKDEKVSQSSISYSSGNSYDGLYYYYDEVHQVGVWIAAYAYSVSVEVVPDSKFANPQLPIK